MKTNTVSKDMKKSDPAFLKWCYQRLERLELEPSKPVLLAMWGAKLYGDEKKLAKAIKVLTGGGK